MLFKSFAKFIGKHLCRNLFFLLKKRLLRKVFFREFWEIFKNNFFTENLRATAPVLCLLLCETKAGGCFLPKLKLTVVSNLKMQS